MFYFYLSNYHVPHFTITYALFNKFFSKLATESYIGVWDRQEIQTSLAWEWDEEQLGAWMKIDSLSEIFK